MLEITNAGTDLTILAARPEMIIKRSIRQGGCLLCECVCMCVCMCVLLCSVQQVGSFQHSPAQPCTALCCCCCCVALNDVVGRRREQKAQRWSQELTRTKFVHALMHPCCCVVWQLHLLFFLLLLFCANRTPSIHPSIHPYTHTHTHTTKQCCAAAGAVFLCSVRLQRYSHLSLFVVVRVACVRACVLCVA